jgi:DNA-binding NarL/FixJ family response regulator
VTPYSLYACESQPIVLEGLRAVLDGTNSFRLIGSSTRAATAIDEISDKRPDVVILDHSIGWREVHTFVHELRRGGAETRVVVWGVNLNSTDCFRAIQIGVRGVFHRNQSVSELLKCLDTVIAGQIWFESAEGPLYSDNNHKRTNMRLTPRERDIVELVAQGMKNREIAEQLAITTGTVKVHLMHVFEKTGVNDRYELAVQARGLLEDSGRR